MTKPYAVEQSERFEGNDWWSWSVWITGPDEALDEVAYVEWTLHPTFPNPVRRVENRESGFRLKTGGWGVFPIVVRIHRKDGRDVLLKHRLQLHKPDGTPVTR